MLARRGGGAGRHGVAGHRVDAALNLRATGFAAKALASQQADNALSRPSRIALLVIGNSHYPDANPSPLDPAGQ